MQDGSFISDVVPKTSVGEYCIIINFEHSIYGLYRNSEALDWASNVGLEAAAFSAYPMSRYCQDH